MNMLYAIGTIFGYSSMGILIGLCGIHLFEHSRGNHRGPVYTAMVNRKAGAIFIALIMLSLTGVYAILTDVLTLLS